MNIHNPSSNPLNLANTKLITKYINDINTYLSSGVGKTLYVESSYNKKNFDKYVDHMESKFTDFAENYYSTFLSVIRQENVDIILSMLNSIDNIKNGKVSVKKAEREIGDLLQTKFVKTQK